MALVLTKETGTGSATANSYASVADADGYFEAHLYASLWVAAVAADKAAALVWATRLIDTQFQFNGFKANTVQALQWPRAACPDPDQSGGQLTLRGAALVADTVVPVYVQWANCEMARELVILDRTTAPPGEGIEQAHLADSSTTIYCKTDTRRILSHVAIAMLRKYGVEVGDRGAVARTARS